MSDWDSIAARANACQFARGGEIAQYSRTGSGQIDSVDPFDIAVIPDLSMESLGNNAKERVVQIQLSLIPNGPCKGDILKYRSKSYTVQELLVVSIEDDIATLGIRWNGTGQ